MKESIVDSLDMIKLNVEMLRNFIMLDYEKFTRKEIFEEIENPVLNILYHTEQIQKSNQKIKYGGIIMKVKIIQEYTRSVQAGDYEVDLSLIECPYCHEEIEIFFRGGKCYQCYNIIDIDL